jgi:hypothetical protein
MSTNVKKVDVWLAAVSWLERNSPTGLAKSELHDYFTPMAKSQPKLMKGLFRQFLLSLSQAGMKERVIIKAMPDGVHSLASVTFDFNPRLTKEHYGSDVGALFRDVEARIKPTGQLRERGLWPKYCKTILSVAAFLSQFPSAPAFYSWARLFADSPVSRPALPLIISEEVDGAGLALACNVLIDLGFVEFAKPDRHVKSILKSLRLVDAEASDYHVLKCMTDLSRASGVTPYALDKALYLIGSGNYSRHPLLPSLAPRSRIRRFTAEISMAQGVGSASRTKR